MWRYCSVVCLSSALALTLLMPPVTADAQIICVSNNVPPPELPIYAQPPIPAPGYIWTPGYWAGSASGYFWVPGTWVEPPAVGLLWTPSYWGWRDGIYVWNAGYWGPHVGFYGGIDYGFGYTGQGYEGGRWDNGVFAYNRTVNNFGGIGVSNVYEQSVVVDETVRVSFNGGSGGIAAQATPEQEAAVHEQHVAAIPAQLQHERVASTNKALLASENHGHPAIAATATPGDFTKGVVAAREATPVPGVAPEKPGGASAVGPNPLANKPLETKPGEHEPGKSEATNGREVPAAPETKPLSTQIKPSNTESKPLNVEAKPLNTVAKPLNGEEKPRAPETKPINGEDKRVNTETKPLNTEEKPVTAPLKPASSEAKLPPTQAKPQLAPHPAAAAPHPAPAPKDKKLSPG
jgi:hypothetical protein